MSDRYRSFSGALIDPENSRLSHDSQYAPSVDSLPEPLLGHPSQRNSKYSLRWHLPRRRFTRYFTLAIGSILVLFVYYLFSASRLGNARLLAGEIERPPPPPPGFQLFPFLDRYKGGIRTLLPRSENVPEYPKDLSDEEEVALLEMEAMDQKASDDGNLDPLSGFQKRDIPEGIKFDPFAGQSWEGYELPVKCYLDNTTKLEIPQLLAYPGVTRGFPDPVMGSHDLLGIRNDVCFDRFGRLGPYGFGYSKKYGGNGAGMEGDREGAQQVWGDDLEIDYRDLKWADVQQRCADANAHRFKPAPPRLNHFLQSLGPAGSTDHDTAADMANTTKSANGRQLQQRTAVVIRTWLDYEYDAEDIMILRALVNELAIQSGSQYVVHFLVHVKDNNLQIWADDELYQRLLDEALPEEFRGMGTLWSEKQMGLIYGGLEETNYRNLPVHGAYRSTYLPMQWFAHMHPEYDFFWHWEMDIRYTGHFYHLFEQISAWAKQQPRKGLWERNGRFYVPSEHGSWEDFRQQVRIETEKGTASKQTVYGKLAADAGSTHPLDLDSRKMPAPVWGPLRPTGVGDETYAPENDPVPPTSYEKDNYSWGVGEDADFITFNPLFDPHRTNWILAEDTTGYNQSDGWPPRRTAIITASRLSRRLLTTMHFETAIKRHTMFSEMWPGSCALHHGFKAVYAPHPVYVDRRWPTSYLTAIFNNGLHGAAGGARTSVFSEERQINFIGTTWYYNAGFAPRLWQRWLGYKIDAGGGEEWELAHEGRMCLPAVLLHPVKQIDLIIEHRAGE